MDISQRQSRVIDTPELIPSNLKFPVVGIGASAGGLAATIRMFENMPDSMDMAFVIVLHLSPEHVSTADQLVQRVTRMPVIQVTKTTKIEKGHVYIIAPKKQMSMNDGRLEVKEVKRERGKLTAIDSFFRTLAEVHRERAIAIVLSGTGSDGAVGLTRIKEQGGLTIAQSINDAEHAGMPSAAIATKMVDFELAVVDIPQKLVELWSNASCIELPPLMEDHEKLASVSPSSDAETSLARIIALLCSHTGHDFRHYKRAIVLRRIERRMQVCAVKTLSEYLAIVEIDSQENIALLADMLIGVTNFFRDREAFDTLDREMIAELFKQRTSAEEVRVWTAACATGEEAYSIAMVLAEHAALSTDAPSFQVFASDIDDAAIKIARTGTYPAAIVTDVSPARLREFFTKDGKRYRIRQTIRDKVLFASHNLLQDPPFSSLDLITCRNLLIYLNRDVQTRLLKMFHFALKPNGLLFLGSSESADAVDEYFIAINKKSRIYRARTMPRTARSAPSLEGLSVGRTPLPIIEKRNAKRQFSYAEVHHRALLEYASPSVIVDNKMNIVHMSKRVGRYMRLDGGEPTRNIIGLVLPELRLDLRTVLYQAELHGTSTSRHNVLISLDGVPLDISMCARAYSDEEATDRFILVIFEEKNHLESDIVTSTFREEMVLTQLEAELQRSREQLQETLEHAEISTEELRASNEELQAINEELRSTTEEFETSREELQSVNEELITVNYELKLKVEETGKANDDLNNLIASIDIATIFVDRAMQIKRFTPRAADIFNMIDTDIGRSLLDITHRLNYPDLVDDVTATRENLVLVEREVRSNNGLYFSVRLRPYRTNEDKIEGVVMTFSDVSARRQAEEQVRASEERMHLVAQSTKDYAIITLDVEGFVTSWNNGAERLFGYAETEMLGQSADVIFTPEDRAAGAADMERLGACEHGRAEDKRWHLRKDGTRLYCNGVMSPLYDNDLFSGYAKIARDETDRLNNDSQREAALTTEQAGRSNAESESALKDEFLAIMSHELRHPLNMMHINVELLLRMPGVKNSTQVSKAVNAIRSSVVSQAKIIEDLLDMSRLNTGKFTVNRSDVCLNDITTSIVNVAKADPASHALSISLIGTEERLLINADIVRIEQVLLNLLSNAIKFTPAGGEIFVRLSKIGDQARLDVSDNGKGITSDFLPHVFDMFGQASSSASRTKGGLGIGLALVRQIVELHGGEVQVNSDGTGKGAQFTIWLPLISNPKMLEKNKPIIPDSLEGLRILLVEDSEDMLMLFKELLQMVGATVSTAVDAAKGLDILLDEKIDVLISDISMPGTDGYEFIRNVRDHPSLVNLPAIAVTGLGRDKDIASAIEAGFSAHVCKPVSLDQLCAKIAALRAIKFH